MKLAPIKDKKKVDTIFKKGFLIKEKSLFIKGYDFGEEESFFGVSVSKKLFRSAVDRNKIKRQLRSVVRRSGEINKVKKGLSFFIVYNTEKRLEFSEINKQIGVLVSKLNME